jgi:hypothetical protein
VGAVASKADLKANLTCPPKRCARRPGRSAVD